jgi:Lrp/AsnC family leucine-responsive transcriptional regulator
VPKSQRELDSIDRGILETLQRNSKTSLAEIGAQVGLSAPSVLERVKKLEQSGVIRGYHALLDARSVGLDVTAFIGVSGSYQEMMRSTFFDLVEGIPDVLECHHVTGEHTLLLKVKTESTARLESVISRIRGISGVERTNTMVVLSTQAERIELPLSTDTKEPAQGERKRLTGGGRRAR